MKLTLEIEMDNAAFDQYAGDELSRIFQKIADKCEMLPGRANLSGESMEIRDSNGNKIGKLKFNA